MCPQSMVACCDASTGDEIPKYREEKGFERQGRCEKAIDCDGRSDGESQKADPVDIIQEGSPSDGREWWNRLQRMLHIVIRQVHVQRQRLVVDGRRSGTTAEVAGHVWLQLVVLVWGGLAWLL